MHILYDFEYLFVPVHVKQRLSYETNSHSNIKKNPFILRNLEVYEGITALCIITSEFFYQLTHYLLDIQNVKIYSKILYSRS